MVDYQNLSGQPMFFSPGARPQRRSALQSGKADLSASSVWAVDALGRIFQLRDSGQCEWHPLPPGWRAEQIAVDGARTVWASGIDSSGGHALWSRPADSQYWVMRRSLPRNARIAGASHGGVFIVGDHGLTHEYGDIEGLPLPSGLRARCVDQGSDGTLWGLAEQIRYGGYAVMRYDHDLCAWFVLPEPAAALRIAGAPDGTAWSISSRGDLWRLHPQGAGHFIECSAVPDCGNCLYAPNDLRAHELAVDSIGNVWFLSDQPGENGTAIGCITEFASRESKFPSMQCGAIAIAADNAASPLVGEKAQP